MIAGTSAGAAVMSEVMITGNQLKYKDYENTFDNIEIKMWRLNKVSVL